MNLTQLDYEILEFINQFESVDKSEIINHFASKVVSIEYRLNLLATPQIHYLPKSRVSIPLENSNYIQEIFEHTQDKEAVIISSGTNFFYITDKGKTALQDNVLKNKEMRKKQIIEWVWRAIPILISLFALAKSYGWL